MLQAGDPLPTGAPDGAGDDARDERLAAFDRALGEVGERVALAYREAGGWLEQTRAGLLELLRFCDERPDTARELVIDSIAWGPDVLERRGQLLDTLAAALDRGRVPGDPAGSPAVASALNVEPRLADPPAGDLADPLAVASAASDEARCDASPSETAVNLVGACVSLVHTRLLQDDGGLLAELAPSLLSMIAQPYLGEETARSELERPLAYAGAQLAEHGSTGAVSGASQHSY
jgi:hypothetical protein